VSSGVSSHELPEIQILLSKYNDVFASKVFFLHHGHSVTVYHSLVGLDQYVSGLIDMHLA
jgi:hypothetical protein